jgi:hypothetical protein
VSKNQEIFLKNYYKLHLKYNFQLQNILLWYKLAKLANHDFWMSYFFFSNNDQIIYAKIPGKIINRISLKLSLNEAHPPHFGKKLKFCGLQVIKLAKEQLTVLKIRKRNQTIIINTDIVIFHLDILKFILNIDYTAIFALGQFCLTQSQYEFVESGEGIQLTQPVGQLTLLFPIDELNKLDFPPYLENPRKHQMIMNNKIITNNQNHHFFNSFIMNNT